MIALLLTFLNILSDWKGWMPLQTTTRVQTAQSKRHGRAVLQLSITAGFIFLNKMFRISRNVFLSCKTCIHIGTGGGWGDPAHNGKGRPGSTHCTHCTNNCITMEPSTQPFSAPMVQSVWSPLVPGISKLSLFCIQPPSLDHHIPSSDSSLKMVSLL